jgi:phosphoribosylamine--glycine ligase
MKVLVTGSGGREHALVWKIRQSLLVYCAPGNVGIRRDAECVDISASDIEGLLNFASRKDIGLTVVGPEAPLVDGIVDRFDSQGLAIFGPTKKASELEGSKVFSKYLLKKYNIPTADYEMFDDHTSAKSYLTRTTYPTVVKADGLAAGKGAIVCQDEDQAQNAIKRIMLDKKFGSAGQKVIVEEFMAGEEASILALTDGVDLSLLPSSQDHKTIFDNDEGPNTGGMGAYAPAPVIDEEMLKRVRTEILEPTIKAMALEGRPYRGVLYAGLMITAAGPKVVEFNCRLGDPEAQAVLPLIKSDLVEVMHEIATEKKISKPVDLHDDQWAMCVVVASGGYPGSYEKGKQIFGLDKDFGENIAVFHAGTKEGSSKKVVTSGGRVLGVTALANDFYEARKQAYWAVGKITFDKAYYRKDIGAKGMVHLRRKLH